MQRGILGQFRGARVCSMALPSPSPQRQTDFGIILKYWRLRGILQKMQPREEVFIPWRVFLFKKCNEQKLRMGNACIGVGIHSFNH